MKPGLKKAIFPALCLLAALACSSPTGGDDGGSGAQAQWAKTMEAGTAGSYFYSV
jgi:hypothetical protein